MMPAEFTVIVESMAMKSDDENNDIPFIRTRKFKWGLLLVTGVVIIVLAGLMSDVLTPVLIGFLLAYIFEPLLEFGERFRVRRFFGVVLIYILLFIAVFLAGSSLVPRLASQSARLYRNISASTLRFGLGLSDGASSGATNNTVNSGLISLADDTNRIADVESEKEAKTEQPPLDRKSQSSEDSSGWTDKHLGLSIEEAKELFRKNADKLATRIAGVFTAIIQKMGTGVSNMINFIFNTLLVLVFAFFFMLHFKEIKSAIRHYIPAANKDVTLRIIHKIDAAVSNFFRGRLLVCLIAGVVSSIGFLLSGLDYWLILGLAAGILGFIPIIGVVVTLVPACAFAMLTSHPVGSLVGVGLTFAFVQMVVEPLVGTLILSHEVKIHPVAIIIALLVGGHLFGTFGMIISIPLAATAKILSEEFLIPPLEELARE